LNYATRRGAERLTGDLGGPVAGAIVDHDDLEGLFELLLEDARHRVR
jgi:hypothetical protein